MVRGKRRSAAVAFLFLALVAGAGCGVKSSRRGPKDVVIAYIRAIEERDADKLAELHVKEVRDKMAKTKKEHPEQFKQAMDMMFGMAADDLKGAKVGEPKVEGGKATVLLTKGNMKTTVRLVKEAGEWKIEKVKAKDSM